MNRTLPALALLTLTACGGAQRLDRSAPAAYTATTAQMARELAGPDTIIVRSDLELQLTRARDGERFTIALQSPWAWCQTEPDDCDDGTKRYLQQALDRAAIAEGGHVDPDAPAEP